MQERDTINVMLVILEAAKIDASINNNDTTRDKASIIYTTLFNDSRLKGYWDILIQEGLLSYDPNVHRFKTTEKGLRFVKSYKAMDYNGM